MSPQTDYIDGIFNYCDRWCERCPFTQRCRNFAMAAEAFPDEESRDVNNRAFWDALSGVFARTIEMLREAAEELGVDIEAIDQEEFRRESEQRRERVHDHPLVRSARAYAEMVNQWFDREGSRFEQKEDELNQEYRLGLHSLDPEAEAIAIGDAVEVVRWYQYQIEVKLVRALTRDAPLTDETERYDANGSTKVALLGIDRSLAAWGVLREAFADQGDPILDLMLRLDRLRPAVERAFPDARAFVRPGFDTAVT